MNFRYVDDLGAGTHDPEVFAARIPAAGYSWFVTDTVVLTDTSCWRPPGAHSVGYMDLHIHRTARSMPLAADVYDRRAEPEFVQHITPIRIPTQIPCLLDLSVGTFSCTRSAFRDLCTYAGYFASRTARYVCDMVCLGYREPMLCMAHC
jgi:hypothetical protein